MSSPSAARRRSTRSSRGSSPSSPSSDPTTPQPCSSDVGSTCSTKEWDSSLGSTTSEPKTSERRRSGSLPTSGIRYEHRVWLSGQSLSGKSTLARELHCSAAPPGVIIDPTASEICGAVPGVVTFSDPSRWPDSDSGRWRFVPADPFDLDAYEAVFAYVVRQLEMGGKKGGWPNAHVWVDEAGDVLPVSKAPPSGKYYWYRAAKLMGGAQAMHTRPREVYRHCLTDAHFVGIFDTPDSDDRDYIAAQCGVPPAVLHALLDRLPPRGFLWLDRTVRPRTLTPCPPLSL
jgi:hypothetical protein